MLNADREMVLRFLAQPKDVNFGGSVHGGTVMKWLDEAGYACATSWSGQYCVTAFVGDINFHSAIKVGNLVEVRAKIIKTGNTSMHIAINLFSCNPKNCDLKKALHCIMVFVAVDENRKPVAVPVWTPLTQNDSIMQEYANKIIEMRKVNRSSLNELTTPN